MARADLILNLVEAGQEGDRALFSETVESLIAEERAKQHHVFAKRLSDTLQKGNEKGRMAHFTARSNRQRPHDGLVEVMPELGVDDLILSSNVLAPFHEVIEEHQRRDLLRSYNLEPRHRILLAGPPGNGKTSLAEAFAEALMVPLYSVKYEHVIGSYLGETASRIDEVFSFVRQHECVLFFDEFDVVGKERGDHNETGEIKRVVSSLLLQIDQLPSHVVIVVASNHPELLDRAAWRRFQLRLHLKPPTNQQIWEWFDRFESKHNLKFSRQKSRLADALEGVSFAEVEQFGLDLLRKYVLSLPDANIDKVVKSKLDQWTARYQNTTS